MRTVTPTLATLVAAVLIGCPSSQPPASDAGTTPVAPEAAVVDEAPTAVPTADPAAPDWAGLHGHMKDHMIQLDRARQALVNGDLTGAKVSYAWLGGHTPVAGLPPGWLPHVEAMQGAAAQGEVAPDFIKAGSALGEIAVTCGACHAANNASIDMPHEPAPIAQPGSKGHMQRHAWASDRMWEGLILPSDERWEQGVRMLNEDVLSDLSDGQPLPEEVMAFGERVHEIGVDGLVQKDPSKRGRLFGDFVAQCASCHSKTGQAPH